MLSANTKNLFCQLLFQISYSEKQIEVIRQLLCENNEFNPYMAYKRIDKARKNQVTSYEIKEFLKDNSFTQTISNCEYFVKQYDFDGDNSLSYNEFLRAILPLDNPDLRLIVAKKPPINIKPGERLGYDIEYTLAKLLDKEIQTGLELDRMKISLASRYDFSIQQVFQMIDSKQKHTLEALDFKNFIIENGMSMYEEELIFLLRRLDFDCDGLISFADFEKSINQSDFNGVIPSQRQQTVQTIQHAQIEENKIGQNIANQSVYQRTPINAISEIQARTNPFSASQFISPNNNDRMLSYTTPESTRRSCERVSKQQINSQASIKYEVAKFEVQQELRKNILIQNKYSPSPSQHQQQQPLQQYNMQENTSTPLQTQSPNKNVYYQYQQKQRRAMSSIPETIIQQQSEKQKDLYSKPQSEQINVDSNQKLQQPYSYFNKYNIKQNSPNKDSPDKMEVQTLKKNTQNVEQSKSQILSPEAGTIRSQFLKSPQLQRDANIQERTTVSKQVASNEVVDNTAKNQQLKSTQAPQKGNQLTLIEIVSHCIIDIIRIEKKLEKAKQDISLRSDFNLFEAFRIMDKNGKGYANSVDLQEFLDQLELRATMNEIYLIMRRYDQDNDGRLRFSDFTEACMPKQEEYAKLLNSRVANEPDKNQKLDQIFSKETLRLLKQLFFTHIDAENGIESLRKQLNSHPNFNYHDVFELLDSNQDGYIQLEEICKFFKDNNIYCTELNILYFIDRIDLNKDHRISYGEFVQELSPKSTYNH